MFEVIEEIFPDKLHKYGKHFKSLLSISNIFF